MDALESHLRRQIEHSRDFFWHRLRWKAVSTLLPSGRPFELVDVGAGAGLLGEFLRRDFPRARYHFVEPIASLEASLEARFTPAANARERRIYRGAEFVTLLDVLEHQAEDRCFLAELADRMEPGATLVVTVPALMRLWSGWDVALGHFRRYDRPAFRRVLDGAPLELKELSYLFPEMLPAALLRTRTRRADAAGGPDAATAEFPDLPRALNDAMYAIGSLSLRLRRWTPAGTSLLAVLVRR